jgi:protein required for attachment to host cells
MSKFKLKHAEWAVVCDGKKALVLCNQEDEIFPQLKVIEEYEHEDKRTHELGTGAPARVHESAGVGRSAIEQTDFHEAAEHKFLEKLIDRVDSAVRQGKVKHLIVVAPPHALGMIRPMYTSRLRAALKEEIAKDWMKMSIAEIEKRLMQ